MRPLLHKNLEIVNHDGLIIHQSYWEKFMRFFERNFITGAFPNMFHIVLFIGILVLFSVDIKGPSIVFDTPP